MQPYHFRLYSLRSVAPSCRAGNSIKWRSHARRLLYGQVRGVFSPNPLFLRKCQARPIRAHTCSAITRRLCGGLGASVAQGLKALRLWQSSRQWRAVPCSCIDAAPGCRLLRRSSVNILTAWPGRVAQAPRAGRARAPWSCSPCWRPSTEMRTVGGPATARRRSELGNC